jgi:hypothetical protein
VGENANKEGKRRKDKKDMKEKRRLSNRIK